MLTILPGWAFFLVQDISDTCHQAFDARLQLHEGAVIGDVGDAAAELRTRGVFGGDAIPRIDLELLHAQADALRVGIEADHLHAHGLADGQRLGGVVDPAPGDVGDMQQAVHTAEIDEGAIIGDVLDHAVQDHAFLETLDQLAALFGARLFQNRTAADDDIAAGAVHFQDLEGLGHAHQRPDIAHGADIDLAAGQEGDRAAEIDGKAAFDPAVDGAVHALLGLEGALQAGPGFLAAGFFAGQDDGAVAVFVALDIELDHVAGLDVRLLSGKAEFLERDAAFGFEADIDDGEFLGQADDPSGDDGAVKAGIPAEGLVEQGGEILAPPCGRLCP